MYIALRLRLTGSGFGIKKKTVQIQTHTQTGKKKEEKKRTCGVLIVLDHEVKGASIWYSHSAIEANGNFGLIVNVYYTVKTNGSLGLIVRVYPPGSPWQQNNMSPAIRSF